MSFVLSTLSATSSCVSSPSLCWSATSFSTRRSTCSPPWRPPPLQRGCCPPTPPLAVRDPCPPSDGATKRRRGKRSVCLPWMKTCGSGQMVDILCFLVQSLALFFFICSAHQTHCQCDTKIDCPVPHTRLLACFLLWISFCCFKLYNVPSEWLSFNNLQHKKLGSFKMLKQTCDWRRIFFFF